MLCGREKLGLSLVSCPGDLDKAHRHECLHYQGTLSTGLLPRYDSQRKDIFVIIKARPASQRP